MGANLLRFPNETSNNAPLKVHPLIYNRSKCNLRSDAIVSACFPHTARRKHTSPSRVEKAIGEAERGRGGEERQISKTIFCLCAHPLPLCCFDIKVVNLTIKVICIASHIVVVFCFCCAHSLYLKGRRKEKKNNLAFINVLAVWIWRLLQQEATTMKTHRTKWIRSVHCIKAFGVFVFSIITFRQQSVLIIVRRGQSDEKNL